MKRDMRTYSRLIREALPYWKIAIVAMLSMIATAAMEPLLPALMAPLIDESLIEKDPRSLIQIPLLIVAVFVIKGISEYVLMLINMVLMIVCIICCECSRLGSEPD